MSVFDEHYDVVVVGAGNAALSAALTALDRGARVLVLERTPEGERGGNSRFTAGGMRFAYDGPDDIIELIPDLTEEEKATTDFGSYPESQFFDDLVDGVEVRHSQKSPVSAGHILSQYPMSRRPSRVRPADGVPAANRRSTYRARTSTSRLTSSPARTC